MRYFNIDPSSKNVRKLCDTGYPLWSCFIYGVFIKSKTILPLEIRLNKGECKCCFLSPGIGVVADFSWNEHRLSVSYSPKQSMMVTPEKAQPCYQSLDAKLRKRLKTLRKSAPPPKLGDKNGPTLPAPTTREPGKCKRIKPCSKVVIMRVVPSTLGKPEHCYVPYLDKSGALKYTDKPVSVCVSGGKYCMAKVVWDNVKMKGHVLLRDVTHEKKTKGGADFEDLKTESVLMELGYNVKADHITTKTVEQRQWLLVYSIDYKAIKSAPTAIRHLEWCIRTHPGERFDEARNKWEADIKFLKKHYCLK